MANIADMSNEEPVQVRICGRDTPLFLKRPGPKITEAEVDAFERQLPRPLPKDYREFLLKYNGGSPVVGEVRGRDDNPDIPYCHGDAVRGFFKLAATGTEISKYEQLRLPQEIPWEVPHHFLLIADDAGGNSFLLDLNSADGTVLFLDHALIIEEGRIMAESFLDLLLRFVTLEEDQQRKDAEKEAQRLALEQGAFPERLEAQCRKLEGRYPDVRQWCRRLSLKVFEEKGFYSVHDDETSRLLLDLMFWLYQNARVTSAPVAITELETIIRGWWVDKNSDDGFGLHGHAPDFFKEWWQDRLGSGALSGDKTKAVFTEEASAEMMRRLERV